jgi:RNA polymerase sigma-70 factor (ECF subfamily)
LLEVTIAVVREAVAGDRRSVRALVDVLTPVIQARVARVLLRRKGAAGERDVRQEVEDLTQQVFLSLFANGGHALLQWDPERGLSLVNFVGLLAEREASSILRSRRRSPFTEDPTEVDDLDRSADSDRGPERITASREILSSVFAILKERLSDRGLELFQWLLIEGRPAEEVCALAGMSPDAVYAWRSRLSKLVREIAAELVSDAAPERHRPKEGTP